MEQKIWVNKSNSFKEAQEFDDSYYLSMTPTERLETVQFRDIWLNRVIGNYG
jgi:hypothetical protein